MLRRQRRHDAPVSGPAAPGSIGSGAADRPVTRNRAVVLEALSGGSRQVPWYRRPVPAALAVLGIGVILFYITTGVRSTTNRPRSDSGVRPGSTNRASSSTVPGVGPSAADVAVITPQGPEVPRAATPRVAAMPASTQTRVPITPRAAGERVPPAVTPPAGDAATGDGRLERALRYQQSGDVENAAAEYRAILRANDANAQAHNNLGLLYQGKGLFEDAVREFSRAIAIDPAYDKARNNLGVAFLRVGKLEAAGAEFRRLLADDQKNQEAMVNLALVQRAGGHADEARETLLRAIGINQRNAVAHYNLALLYEEAREITRALDHYDAYLKYADGTDATQTAAVREHCQALRQRLVPRQEPV
jgi:Tfp pilus assembly protein PilF